MIPIFETHGAIFETHDDPVVFNTLYYIIKRSHDKRLSTPSWN